MQRLRLAMLLLLFLLLSPSSVIATAAGWPPAQNEPQHPACVATLPGARVGMAGGYCYETIVANTGKDTPALPLVIGLHWSGSSPGEFRQVLAGIKHPVRLVLVQGRHVRRAGFSFYPVAPYYYDMDAAGQRAVQLAESDRMAAFAKQMSVSFRACGRPVVVGASQGGDLSYLLGLRHPDEVGLAIPLMATLHHELVPDQPVRAIPIHAMHGVVDPIVSIDTARALAQAARSNGFDVSLTEFADTGHDVPPAMRDTLAALVDAYLARLVCAR